MSLTAGTRAEQAAVLGLIGKGIGLAAGGIKWGGIALATQFGKAVSEAAAPYEKKSQPEVERTVETPPPAAKVVAQKAASFDQSV